MSNPVAASKKIARELDEIEKENLQGINLQHVDAKNPNQPYLTQPAAYFEKDPYDDKALAKNYLTKSEALGNKIEVTDEDIDYLLGQRKKEELFQYDTWFYDTFKFGADPNKIAVAKKMNPQWFSRREAEISKQIEICKKLAKLSLRGPRSEEDVKVLYALDQGRINVPNLDLLFPEKAKKVLDALGGNARNVVISGYWNPKSYASQRDVPKGRNQYDANGVSTKLSGTRAAGQFNTAKSRYGITYN